MEDIKTTKINNAAADLPEVKRTVTGEIDLEAISTGKNEKGNYIVPDDILEAYYKELPDGTINQSGNAWIASKGILRMPNEDIRRLGAEALNARVAQRKKLRETIEILLTKPASKASIEELGLPAGADKQTAGVARMIQRWEQSGDYQLFQSIRDTVGEKPVSEISAQIEEITPEDKELLQRVNARLNSNT